MTLTDQGANKIIVSGQVLYRSHGKIPGCPGSAGLHQLYENYLPVEPQQFYRICGLMAPCQRVLKFIFPYLRVFIINLNVDYLIM